MSPAVAESHPGAYIVNMSLGDSNRPDETTCGSSALHQAVCTLTNDGVTVVAAAGNDGSDAAGFVPAAYDEVIAVSAFTDFDGQRSSAGCQSDFSDYGYQCDDTLADFSNYGSVIDVTAPGIHVLSDWIDGGLKTHQRHEHGRAPRRGRGRVGARRQPEPDARAGARGARVDGRVPRRQRRQCADLRRSRAVAVGGLFGTTPDKDGIPEPLVNGLRAAQAAGTPPPPPRRPSAAASAAARS